MGTHTGSFNVAASANITFTSTLGPLEISASSAITGTGDIVFSSENGANVRGTYNITGAGTTLATGGATVVFHSTITSVGAALLAIGGNADMGSNTFTVPTLYLESGGSVSGTGTITATNTVWWNGATMSGAGTTIASNGINFGNNIFQGGLMSGRTLINYGAATAG